MPLRHPTCPIFKCTEDMCEAPRFGMIPHSTLQPITHAPYIIVYGMYWTNRNTEIYIFRPVFYEDILESLFCFCVLLCDKAKQVAFALNSKDTFYFLVSQYQYANGFLGSHLLIVMDWILMSLQICCCIQLQCDNHKFNYLSACNDYFSSS